MFSDKVSFPADTSSNTDVMFKDGMRPSRLALVRLKNAHPRVGEDGRSFRIGGNLKSPWFPLLRH
jgi:hypothetical protein